MKYQLILKFIKTEDEETVHKTVEHHTFYYIEHTGYYTTTLTKKFNKYPQIHPADIENCIDFEDYDEQTIELTERNKENTKYYILYRILPL